MKRTYRNIILHDATRRDATVVLARLMYDRTADRPTTVQSEEEGGEQWDLP